MTGEVEVMKEMWNDVLCDSKKWYARSVSVLCYVHKFVNSFHVNIKDTEVFTIDLLVWHARLYFKMLQGSRYFFDSCSDFEFNGSKILISHVA